MATEDRNKSLAVGQLTTAPKCADWLRTPHCNKSHYLIHVQYSEAKSFNLTFRHVKIKSIPGPVSEMMQQLTLAQTTLNLNTSNEV